MNSGRPVNYVVGHSLGGWLAQLVSRYTGVPLVTFNAPGLLSGLGSVAAPVQMVLNTYEGLTQREPAGRGRNFRVITDVVSSWGSHYGPVVRMMGLNAGGFLKNTLLHSYGAHTMGTVCKLLKKDDWGDRDPLESALRARDILHT